MLGKIKCVKEKGFGFICPEGGGLDIFFHASKVSGMAFEDIKEGQIVEFDVMENAKGRNAIDVHPKF